MTTIIKKESNQKKDTPSPENGVLSKINDTPDQKETIEPSDKKEGIISKVNDKTDQKKK